MAAANVTAVVVQPLARRYRSAGFRSRKA
jgi:hypothetical protein